ncbi:MAG: tetraacyldisaccharide 4'-kinase [Hydrogenophaga sp.]|jgi:tetraacyldisaccharide 4'-kinase|uniref:tetraacyldisaccharide 4'-kinase n=1 Tax=Hydrogenophaga sp. TaxID=1904254 RepID=UPI002619DCE7|nr:tetraacyldisaccharide 4'-kinase [Hydrogenophaga sp.]MCV0440699.1 tetraacyldisaccharide 4'-kinase [Hydrogenophaga sp.]
MSQRTGPTQWQAAWVHFAQHRGVLNTLLWPASLLYRSLVAIRRCLYAAGVLRVHRLDVPVVVVGNVVVGGAGKTPCTIALVNHLASQGWRPGVVSRGHGRQAGTVSHVRADSSASDVGDEPLLIHRHTGAPVCVAARRVDAAHALRALHPQVDVLVCDDGLQHLALGRDLAIVVFDDRGSGNGWMLPAGLLREPWPPLPRSPFRPHMLLRQGRMGGGVGQPVDAPGLQVFGAERRLATHAIGPQGQRIPLTQLRDQSLIALAGIARPRVFFDMLRSCGVVPAQELALQDHADPAVYAELLRHAQHPVICTEKDAVKLFALLPPGPPDAPPRAWAVPLELTPDPAFLSAVDAHLAPFRPVG